MLIGYMNNPAKDLIREIEFAGELSFDYFELTVEAPLASPAIIKYKKRRVLDHLLSYNMGVMGHMPWFLHIAFPYDSVQRACLAEFERAIDTACDLGAKKVTIHTEFLPKFFSTRGQLVEHTTANLGYLKDYTARQGAKLLVENYMDFSFSALEFSKLVKHLNIDMTYDVGHEFANTKGKNKAILDFAKKFSKQIKHVHFSDNMGDKDAHLAIGQGKIDWKGTVAGLKKFYDGTITLEVHNEFAKGKEKETPISPKSVFASKKEIEKLWYGNAQVKNDYKYIYPKGHKYK